MKTYDRESWFQECRRNKPTLTRTEFDKLWVGMWMLAHAFGAAVDMRTASQN